MDDVYAGFSRHYTGSRHETLEAKYALDAVAATIFPGEFVAVIGKSGAGKTTLLRCLARATAVTEGAIRSGQQDLAMLRGSALRRHRARVGMIYQQFNLVKRLPVLTDVLIGRLPHLTGWRWGIALTPANETSPCAAWST
jgi:phosphonate transport system ATP-binding protein